MREESHLDDMRSALRGDFERLAARRGAQELMRVSEDAPPDEAAVRGRPSLPEPEPKPELGAEGAPSEERRRPWLDRLLGR